MAAPIEPEKDPFRKSMGDPATSQAHDTSQIDQAPDVPSETGQVQPDPTESPSQEVRPSLIGATADRRARLLTTAGLLGGLAFCIVVALGLRFYLAGASRDLTAEIPLAEGDRVTTITWSPGDAATLLAGTSLGQLYRVRASGTPEAVLTRAKGPIVTIFPLRMRNAGGDGDAAPPSTGSSRRDVGRADTLDADAHVVWLDPTADGDTPFRADDEPTFAGLAASVGSQLLPVVDLPAAVPAPNAGGASNRRSKSPTSKQAVQAPSQATALNLFGIDASSADGIVSAVGSARRRDLFDLVADASTDETVIVGYRDGSMRVTDRSSSRPLWTLRADASVPAASADPPAGRSVVTIAPRSGSQQAVTAHAAFAWATANGDIRVFRRGAGSNPPRIQRVEMAEGATTTTGQAAPPAVSRPVPIHAGRDGLSLSADGDVLMIYGRGGLALARLSDVPTGDVARIFWRYLPEELAATPVELASGEVVRLQQALAARGFDPGPRDGLLGPSTLRALESFKATTSLGDALALCSLLLACPQSRVSAAALSPSGEAFAIAGNDGVIRIVTLPRDLRDLPNAQSLRIRGHGDVITRLSISPDGRYLASLSVDGRLRLIDLPRARQVGRWPLHDLPSGPDMPEMAPIRLPPGSPSPGATDPIVVLSSSDSLQAAQAESARVAASGLSGLGAPAIYQWANSTRYYVVLRVPDASTQLREMVLLRSLPRWSRSAYPAQLNELCQSPVAADGVFRCSAKKGDARAN